MNENMLLIIIKIFGIVIGFLSQVFYTKIIGIKAYGVYTLFITWINILSMIIMFGYDQIIIKHLGRTFISKETSKFKYILVTCFKIVLINCVIFVVIGSIIPVDILKKTILPNDTLRSTWIVIVIGTVVFTIYKLIGQVLTTIQKVKQSIFYSEVLVKVFAIVFTIIIFYVFAKDDISRDNTIIQAMVYSYIVILLIIAILYRKIIKTVVNYEKEVVVLRKEGIILFFIGINYYLISQIDKIFVARTSNMEMLGIYGLAVTLSQLVGFSTILYTRFLPKISHYILSKNMNILENEFEKITTNSLIVSLPFIAFMIFFPSDIFLFFGKNLTGAAVILQILMLGQIVNYFTGPNGSLLIYGNYANVDFINSIAGIILNIVLNIIGYKLYGITGIALAAGVSLAFVNILKVVEVKIIYNIFPYKISTIFLALISFFSYYIVKVVQININNIIIKIGVNFLLGLSVNIILLLILAKLKVIKIDNIKQLIKS